MKGWLPQQLKAVIKEHYKNICQQPLLLLDDFVMNIDTSDKYQIHHYDIENRTNLALRFSKNNEIQKSFFSAKNHTPNF